MSVIELFEFANLYTSDTNIGTTIWIQEKPADMKLQHDMRLKVMPRSNKMNINDACDVVFNRSGDITAIKPNKNNQTISGKVKRKLEDWIKVNIEILILHWEQKISTVEFMKRYRPL